MRYVCVYVMHLCVVCCVLCVACCVRCVFSFSFSVFFIRVILLGVLFFFFFFFFLSFLFLCLFGSDFWRYLGGMDGYAFERRIGKGYTFIPTAWFGRIQLTIGYLPFNGHNTCESPPEDVLKDIILYVEKQEKMKYWIVYPLLGERISSLCSARVQERQTD